MPFGKENKPQPGDKPLRDYRLERLSGFEPFLSRRRDPARDIPGTSIGIAIKPAYEKDPAELVRLINDKFYPPVEVAADKKEGEDALLFEVSTVGRGPDAEARLERALDLILKIARLGTDYVAYLDAKYSRPDPAAAQPTGADNGLANELDKYFLPQPPP